MKADRLPRWAQRRLTPEQRGAYDRLRWHSPDPADRARLKIVLGWRRTREETLALADELLADGLLKQVVADRVGVSDRYLRRLLAEKQATPQNAPPNPTVHAAEMAPTCETDTGLPPDGDGGEERPPGRPPIRFRSFRELDEWLGMA